MKLFICKPQEILTLLSNIGQKNMTQLPHSASSYNFLNALKVKALIHCWVDQNQAVPQPSYWFSHGRKMSTMEGKAGKPSNRHICCSDSSHTHIHFAHKVGGCSSRNHRSRWVRRRNSPCSHYCSSRRGRNCSSPVHKAFVVLQSHSEQWGCPQLFHWQRQGEDCRRAERE